MEYPKFDWKYIAGFLDGEGSIGLYINQEEDTFIPIIQMKQYHRREFLINLREWLKNEGINGRLGGNNSICISSWNGVKLFCEKISPYVILKKEEMTLLMEAINLYFSTTKEGRKKYTKPLWNSLVDLAIRLQDLKSGKGYRKRNYRKYFR